MQTHFTQPPPRAGSVLLVSILATLLLICLVLLAYLGLIQQHTKVNARHQARQGALPLAEAGVEEAMCFLHSCIVGGQTNQPGWQDQGNGTWSLQRNLSNDFFVVTITNFQPGISTTNPVIESYGYVAMSAALALGSNSATPPSLPFTVPDPGLAYLGRGVRAETTAKSRYRWGLAAAHDITLMNSISVASTNISGGPETDRAYIKSLAWGIFPHAGTCRITVKGYSFTGPESGIFNQAPLGFISFGSAAFAPVTEGIEPSRWRNDARPEVFAPVAPPGLPTGESWKPFNAGCYRANVNSYVLSNGFYTLSASFFSNPSASLPPSSRRLYVEGQATLWVQENVLFTLQNMSGITIVSNASLRLFLGNPGPASIGAHILATGGESWGTGYNAVNNRTGNPTNFVIFGLPTCPRIQIHACSNVAVVVYAPQSAVNLNANGPNKTPQFLGSVIADRIGLFSCPPGQINHLHFAQPEEFETVGPPDGYVISAWSEIGGDHFVSFIPPS
jgi:hypothetical protein